MHEFVHFTGEKKLLAAQSGEGAKQEKGKPYQLLKLTQRAAE